MDSKSNVIDFRRAQKRVRAKGKSKSQSMEAASVTDISQMRADIINDERRRVKRTILSEFIGATVVVPSHGLMKVVIYDISEDGIAFDVDSETGKFNVGEEVAVRVYMNNQTYFPFNVKITHVAFSTEEDVYRHGARFNKGNINEMALYHFVKFIENVSANLKNDSGDIMVSNIK